MPIDIQLPRLGWSMEEGKFLAWLKNHGDSIKEGEPLFTLESDKAAQEVESIDSGILAIPTDGPKSGQIIKVGEVLGYLLAQGEAAPATLSERSKDSDTSPRYTDNQRITPASRQSADPARYQPIATLPRQSCDSPVIPASPRARRAAKELHIDLSTLQPSGLGGRIRERDVLAAAKFDSSKSEMQSIPLTQMRRTIAARLTRGRATTVPVTITCRCDATALLALRQELKAKAEEAHLPVVPTVNDLFVKLAGSALRQHPMLSAIWGEDQLLVPRRVHLGIAVDTEEGLLVPVIRDVATSTLKHIAAQSSRLITAARAGKLLAADMQGACFTLSNLGTLGVEAFTPVINPPESAILGIGAILREAVPQEDGTFSARQRLTVSLTFDHRVNDGAAAARFLQTLRHLIEHPLIGLV